MTVNMDSVANNKKTKKFKIPLDEVRKIYPDPDDFARVITILEDAENQSERKEIPSSVKVNSLKRFLAKWHIRFRYGIHWKKPLYPLRLIRNYGLSFFYRIFGVNKYVFRGIEFALTFRCNFNCSHCLCARIVETETRQELTPQEYRRLVKEAMKMGALTFGAEGGEPFVKKNWEEIVEAWQPKYNHVQVSSNGYLFDEKLAKKCADIGIDTINFSLDSGIPELHDLFRRKRGSFDRVMRAVDLCDKYGIKVIFNTVVHTGNLYTEGFIKLLEFAESKKILVNILFAKGVGAFKDKNAMLTGADFAAFYKIVAPFNYWSIHHGGEVKSNHGGTGCPGVKEMFNMTPYGDVMNCANNHIYFGNVRDESLQSIRERALKETPFGKYRPCFLTQDKHFMQTYYPLLEEKGHMTIQDFRTALRSHEKTVGHKVYPELD